MPKHLRGPVAFKVNGYYLALYKYSDPYADTNKRWPSELKLVAKKDDPFARFFFDTDDYCKPKVYEEFAVPRYLVR